MNIHKHGNRYDLPTLAKNHRTLHARPGGRIGIGPSSPHDQKVPSATVRLGNGYSLSRVREWGEELFFLEMKKNAGIFSSIYNRKKIYYTWDLIISKCY